MNFIDTVISWGRKAWGSIFGGLSDISGALQDIWNFIGSIDNLLTWVVGMPVRALFKVIAFDRQLIGLALEHLQHAQERQPAWTWLFQIYPVEKRLVNAINAVFIWAQKQFALTWVKMYSLYYQALAYAYNLVLAERNARIKAVAAEHAAMLLTVKAALAEVQKEAASGYNSANTGRAGVITSILDDIASRTPAVGTLIGDLIKGVLDLETIDDPLLRWLLGKIIGEVLSRIGVDRAAGDLAAKLINDFSAAPKATDLHSAVADLAKRVGTLEQQWAQFMTDGGPEVEQAGEQWKAITSLAADGALIGLFSLGSADPHAWATGMADTVGAAGNAVMTGIVDLIRAA